MPRRVMPRCDGKADLVVELRRRRNIAFLLNMESHAGGTGLNAATIRSELPGDNWGFVLCRHENFWFVRRCLGRRSEWPRSLELLVGSTQAQAFVI